MWYDKLDGIYLINLNKRTDRLITSTNILRQYQVPFERFEATELESGILGLISTMKKLFTQCIEKNFKNVLVFEDDLDMLTRNTFFNAIMENVVSQMPESYDLIYLGCNAAQGLRKKYSENLIELNAAYATHAVIWSRKAMQFIIDSEIGEPLDNFLVKTIQKNNNTYCTYPMLVSQKVGYSDINKKIENWKFVLENRFNKFASNIK